MQILEMMEQEQIMQVTGVQAIETREDKRSFNNIQEDDRICTWNLPNGQTKH